MRMQSFVGALALAGTTVAFSDSTPFALLSTSTFASAPSPNQIQTSNTVLKYSKDVLALCPTDRYLIVTQPGLRSIDLSRSSGCTLPHLCKAAEDSRLQGRYTVSEVVGEVDRAELTASIEAACSEKNKDASVEEVSLSSVSQEDKASLFQEHDAILAESLGRLTASDSYTILFLSTLGEPTTYESDFAEPLHMDLKRQIQSSPVRRQSNNTDWNKLPLFEKYQFFTPGIFMAIVTAVVLLSILYVGISALSSLEVSYGAFEKDMGPAAQKKQQ